MPAWEKYGKERYRLPGKWVQATLVEEVQGIHYRKPNVRAFCKAVKRAERLRLEYGVALAPQSDNQHDPNAIAVLGQCMVKRLFRSPKLQEWHIGYVARELAAELQSEFLRKDIPIASELYEIFQQGDFYEIKFIVLAPPGYSHGRRMKKQGPRTHPTHPKPTP